MPPADAVQLEIARQEDDIRISWDVTTYGGGIALFMLTGDGSGQYTNNYEGWVPVIDEPIIDGIGFDYTEVPVGRILVLDQFAGGANELYFKAFTTSGPSDANAFAAAPAVGKINIDVSNSYALYSVPLIPLTGDRRTWALQDIFGDQINNGEIQYAQGGLLRVVCEDGIWPDKNIEVSKGFWLKANASKKISIIGGVLSGEYNRNIVQGYDLYGIPMPVKVEVAAGSDENFGIQPREGDEIQLLYGGGLVRYVYGAAGWGSSFDITLAKGFWYKNPSTDTRVFVIVY